MARFHRGNGETICSAKLVDGATETLERELIRIIVRDFKAHFRRQSDIPRRAPAHA